MVGFIVFFVAGFVFGYAAPGRSAFLPVIFPLLIGIYTALSEGLDGHVVLLTVIGVVVTIVGVVLGRLLLNRLEGPQAGSSA